MLTNSELTAILRENGYKVTPQRLAVEILNRLHVIQIINTGEDSFRYDADTSDHHHVQCTCCGKVEDLFNVDASGIMHDAEKHSGYKLSGHQFYFYGVCEDCRKKH